MHDVDLRINIDAYVYVRAHVSINGSVELQRGHSPAAIRIRDIRALA